MSFALSTMRSRFSRRWWSRLALGGLTFVVFAGAAGAGVGPAALTSCIQSEALFYSTEVDFLTSGPEPPDGNPLISDGDLLGLLDTRAVICARNEDLLTPFGVTADLGLDAVDVVTDGERHVVLFSTELDDPSPESPFRAGDLLASNGAIIPNEVLLQLFSIGHDIGLDAVHAVGEERALIEFWSDAAQLERQEWINDPQILIDLLGAHDVDLLVSTEGTALLPSGPGFLLDGDLLSTRTGIVVASNDQLLPASVPAGLPIRGVDYGLDAVSADRSEQVEFLQFSTEISYVGARDFDASDIVGYQLAWGLSGAHLLWGLEPKSAPLGLDALAIAAPEPSALTGLSAGVVLLVGLARRQRSKHAQRAD